MLTWYSAMLPSRMSTRCSLIEALRTLRSVFVARATPDWMASSKLFCDVELISVTRGDCHGVFLRWASGSDGWLVFEPYQRRPSGPVAGTGPCITWR